MAELARPSEAPGSRRASLGQAWDWLSFENATASRSRFLAVHLALETLLIIVGFQLYSIIADHAPRHAQQALGRTDRVLRAERAVHLSPELWVNTWWARSHLRETVGNYYYDGPHFIVTALVLTLLLVLRPHRYRLYRDILLVASLLALVVFWLCPVGPPRLLPSAGFVDTVARVRTFGAGGQHGITSAENPFASMPSLHVGWALWVAMASRALTDNRLLRALAWCYPALTTFVVIATGNHLLADAAAAAVLLPLSSALVHVCLGARETTSREPARREVASE
ncbi:phosphatase PAP2 family protein [Pseudofrankia sp. DC12]|uniref:phosphatase PAP2 family protein n=1 Tax=Pseudofrankia sp. DC12 TaxID=683315 RepID=UPI0005F7B6AE